MFVHASSFKSIGKHMHVESTICTLLALWIYVCIWLDMFAMGPAALRDIPFIVSHKWTIHTVLTTRTRVYTLHVHFFEARKKILQLSAEIAWRDILKS